jgi:glucose-6-phosphate isomerase
MHVALRVPDRSGHEVLDAGGENALAGIHREWDRIERLASSYRIGQLRGAAGAVIRTVLVIGRGVPIGTLKFVRGALERDERAVLAARYGMAAAANGSPNETNPAAILATRLRRNLAGMSGVVASMGSSSSSNLSQQQGGHPRDEPSQQRHASLAGRGARRLTFLSSVDPVAAADVLSDLDPGSTLVVSIALRGDEETGLATKLVKSWLLQALAAAPAAAIGPHSRGRTATDYVLKHHMILVTGNDHIASVINKPESVHVIPEHTRCEPFTSFTSAVLLVRDS